MAVTIGRKGRLSRLIGRKNARSLRNVASGLAEGVRQHRNLQRYGVGYYNFWRIGLVTDSWFYRFLQRPALRHLAARRRVAFFSVNGPNRWLVNAPSCDRRIFFTGENLDRFSQYEDCLSDVVDLTLGFDDRRDTNYLRFPLWLLECFDPAATITDIGREIKTWEQTRQVSSSATRKTAAVLISRHDSNGVRGRIGDLIEKTLPVTYAGAFRNNTDQVLGGGWHEKLALMERYRFSICPENSNRKGYVTEKLFHAVQAGCLPIYWGSDNQAEPAIFNQSAILFFEPERPEALTIRLRQLLADESALANFALQPIFLDDAAQRIYRYYADLENRLITLLE